METLLSNSPLNAVNFKRQELNFFNHSLMQALKANLDKRNSALFSVRNKLDSLNPLSILQRGYSITRRLPEMKIIKDPADVKTGDSVNILLAKGHIDCVVKKTVKTGGRCKRA